MNQPKPSRYARGKTNRVEESDGYIADTLEGLQDFFKVDANAGMPLIQAARHYGCSVRTIKKWVSKGKLGKTMIRGPLGPEWRVYEPLAESEVQSPGVDANWGALETKLQLILERMQNPEPAVIFDRSQEIETLQQRLISAQEQIISLQGLINQQERCISELRQLAVRLEDTGAPEIHGDGMLAGTEADSDDSSASGITPVDEHSERGEQSITRWSFSWWFGRTVSSLRGLVQPIDKA